MSNRTVRHRDDGPSRALYRHLDVASEPGDELTLDAEAAAYLVDQGHHEYVDDPGPGPEPDADDSADSVDEDEDAEDVTESGYAYETYPRAELEAKEYNDLQKLAAEADHPDVDGRSSRADIIDALAADGADGE